jgi:hypothetical protein
MLVTFRKVEDNKDEEWVTTPSKNLQSTGIAANVFSFLDTTNYQRKF